MAKQQWHPVFLIGIFALIVILAIVFWVDDLTIIGEIIDPIEFIALGVIGFYGGSKLKK